MHVMTEAPLWTDAMAVYPYSEGVEAAYRFVSKYGDTVNMAVHRGSHILVPRRMAPIGKMDNRVKRPFPARPCLDILYEEQRDCAEKSLKLLRDGVNHIMEAPTGWGKSVVGAAIACELGQTTLIVVNKQDLMDSWYESMTEVLEIPSSEIGIAQGKKLDYKGKRIVLAMAQSLMRPDKYDNEFWSYFGFVIFDEVDVMAAECISYIPTKPPGYYRLGMSATPSRNDGKTPVLTAHIGTVMVRGTDVPMSPKILTHKTGWYIPKGVPVVVGKMANVYNVMATNPLRNQIIVDFIKLCYKRDRNLVVMADTLDHLHRLQALSILQGIPAIDCGMYIGPLAKDKPLLKANAMKRVIFATYGMCSRGTNFPRWDALIYASPRSNVKQPLGRILRRKEGKKQPVCLDLIDGNDIFHKFFYKRLKTYNEVHAEVKAYIPPTNQAA